MFERQTTFRACPKCGDDTELCYNHGPGGVEAVPMSVEDAYEKVQSAIIHQTRYLNSLVNALAEYKSHLPRGDRLAGGGTE